VLLVTALGCSDGPLDADAVTVSPQSQLRSVQGAVDTPTIDCVSPANFHTVVLGSGQTVAAVEVTWTSNVEAELAGGSVSVTAFDNSLPVASTQAAAPFGLELVYGEHLIVLEIVDETDGQPFSNPEARCSIHVRVSRPCIDAADCDDDYFCNTTSCAPGADGTQVCNFGPPPIPGCCTADIECGGQAVCDELTHTCVSCTADAHCDDGNGCTTDSCQAGACKFVKDDPDCCDCGIVDVEPIAQQCGSGGVCNEVSCNCGANQCSYTPIDNPAGKCCETGDHAICDDGDPCTDDSCVANVCRNIEALGAIGCCTTDAECNDGNACTVDGCDVNTDTCVHTKLDDPTCCTTNEDCDDGDVTTWDTCVTWQCVYTDNFNWCELPEVSAIVINELMINPGAVGDSEGEWIELYNTSDSAVDLDGWALTGIEADAVTAILIGVVVEPGGYAVLCNNSDSATNGGVACDFQYDPAYQLSNSGDSVVLKSPANETHDEVNFDGGPNFPNPTGASISLVNPQNDNDVGGSWKTSLATVEGLTDKGTPGQENLDVFQIFEMVQCHEQPNDDACTVDTCVGNTCAHIAIDGCCNTGLDCAKPTLCHVPECVDHACEFTFLPPPDCCLVDDECNDGLACTLDKCISGGCAHGPDPDFVGGECCLTSADCSGATNTCLTVECDEETHSCNPPSLIAGPGCCTQDTYPDPAQGGECDDGDPSTVDTCKDFNCLSIPDPNYCDAQPGQVGANNCHLDGNPCTDDSCDLATKTCLFNPVPDCCSQHADCFDGDPCTQDTCNPKTGACAFIPIQDCCFASTEAADCDDANPCTEDFCANLQPLAGTPGESWGQCRNVKSDPACCNSNIECSDGNVCTQDQCDLTTNTCTQTALALPGGKLCCDPLSTTKSISDQCDDGNNCTTATCANNSCQFEAVPPNQFGSCCDLNAPGASSEAVQCSDNNECTLDKCIFGRCRSVVQGGNDCCDTDSDCDDNDQCTTDACVTIIGTKVCSNIPVECDDGKYCNGEEECLKGFGCFPKAGSEPSLDDGISCTVGFCDEASDQVQFFPDDSLCDDKLYCNGLESCSVQDGGCLDGPAPAGPDDGVDCTINVCNEDTDSFEVTADDDLCDDGQECTGIEKCDLNAGCLPGEGGVAIDDGISCTVDQCLPDGTTAHTPDNSLCNDNLGCTTDTCDTETDCGNVLAPGFCLIAGVCYAPGATNPLNGCELCDPAVSTTDWTLKGAKSEECNGLDDDCDGEIDEDIEGDPLVQPCENACGEKGIEVCKSGGYDACTAPELEEICNDNLDNDCDGITDGPDCGKPGVGGAEVTFGATLGQVSNVVVDNGDGTYTTVIGDLANPNNSGAVFADAYGKQSANASYSVNAAATAVIEVIAMRDELFIDKAQARLAVQVTDAFSRPVKTGTVVTGEFTGAGVPPGAQASCTTDPVGRCVIIWSAPAAAFDTEQSIMATVSVGAQSQPAIPIAVVKAAQPVAIAAKEVGIQLPQSPLFPGATFQVPVYINSGGAPTAGYNIHLFFNKVQLNATAVTAGACTAFPAPLSNLTTDANVTGSLTFNAIKLNDDPCITGDKVHVANVTFTVQDGLVPDDPSNTAEITCKCFNVFDANLINLCNDTPCSVGGGSAADAPGEVATWSNKIMGIFARNPDAQLLNWAPLTDAADSVQLKVTAYHRDFSVADVASDSKTGYGSTDPGVATVGPGGQVTIAGAPGESTIAVSYGGSVSTTHVRVLVPTPLNVKLSDDTLQPIKDAITPVGAQLRQRSKLVLESGFNEGGDDLWVQDHTPKFLNAAQVSLPGALSLDVGKQSIFGATPGSYDVTIKSPTGNTVGTAPLSVSASPPATCTGLQVIAPCDVAITKLSDAPVTNGTTVVTATVSAYMNKYQQTCQAQVYAQYDDGSRQLITGTVGVKFSSAEPALIKSSNSGLLTALGPGQVNIQAIWELEGKTLCAGQAPVVVDLPAATSSSCQPANIKLAQSAGDPAATIKGLSTSQQLKVLVNYADGTTIDFSDHPSVAFAVEAGGGGIVSVTPTGLVQSTGGGSGAAKVNCSVGLYPELGDAPVNVEVVSAGGITGDVYEPYTPTPPRVTDHTLSYIEGTTTRQDGNFEVTLAFTDGSTADITQNPALVIETILSGTSIPLEGVVTFDKATKRALPGTPGNVDVTFTFAGKTDQIVGFKVDSNNEGIVLLTPLDVGTTFTGIKDTGTMVVKAWGLFNDGTRRRFFDSRYISGLLQFGSTVPSAATINIAGVATIHGNKSTVFTIDLNESKDSGSPYDPPAEYGVDCNLAAGCGDFDLGDTVGLAFKDREPGEVFTLEGRANTCGNDLAAFDVELSHDKAVLDVLELADVEFIGAAVGGVCNANPLSEPGNILINCVSMGPDAPVNGNNIKLFTVKYKGLKAGDGISEMAGIVKSIITVFDGFTVPIGPLTPRPIIAGAGDLDPQCPGGELEGDADGNCVVNAADVLYIRQVLAGQREDVRVFTLEDALR